MAQVEIPGYRQVQAVQLYDQSSNPLASASAGNNSDAVAVAATGLLPADAYEALYNGASWDRRRGNVDTGALVTLTAQAAGTVNSADQTNWNGRGAQVLVNITVAGGTPTLTVTIQGKDAASGTYYTLLTSAALASVAATLLTVYPGAPTTANVSAPQVLPRTWRISAVVAGTTPAVTATIGASVIV